MLKRISFLVLFFICLYFVGLVLTIVYLPTSTDYSVFNSDWNGLSNIQVFAKPIFDFKDIVPRNSLVLIINPLNLSSYEKKEIINYIRNGGYVLLASDSENVNSFLNQFGSVSLVNITVLDNAYYYKSFQLPKIVIGNFTVILNMPCYLDVMGAEWNVVAYTSRFSFKDVNKNSVKDFYEENGPFPVFIYKDIDKGRIYVLSDSDVFINSMLEISDNEKIIDFVAGNRSVYLYVNPSWLMPIDRLKTLFTSVKRPSYLFLGLSFVLSSLIGFLYRYSEDDRKKSALVSLVYLGILCLYGFYFGDIIAISYFLFILFLFLVWKNDFFVPHIVTISLYLSSINPILYSLIMPISFIYPFIYRLGNPEKIDVVGSASKKSLITLLVLSSTIFLNPSSILIISMMASFTLIVTLIMYYRLSKTTIKVTERPVKIVLGRQKNINFLVESPTTVRLQVYVNDEIYVFNISNKEMISIPYKPEVVGYKELPFVFIIEDSSGLASRRLNIVVEINTVPTTQIALDLLRRNIGNIIETVGEFLERAGLYVSKGKVKRGIKEIGEEYAVATYGPVLELEPFGTRPKRWGDYIGVRPYLSGDNPRNIHWKKSLAHGELIVKEFSSSGGGGSGGGYGRVIYFIDLVSCDPLELDRLAYSSIAVLSYSLRLDARGEKILFLTTPDNITYVFKGYGVEVLAALASIFTRKKIFTQFNYRSVNEVVDNKAIKSLLDYDNEFVKKLVSVNERFFVEVLRSLRVNGIFNANFTVIHGRPTSFKYSFLRYRLEREGFRYVSFRVPNLSGLKYIIENLRV